MIFEGNNKISMDTDYGDVFTCEIGKIRLAFLEIFRNRTPIWVDPNKPRFERYDYKGVLAFSEMNVSTRPSEGFNITVRGRKGDKLEIVQVLLCEYRKSAGLAVFDFEAKEGIKYMPKENVNNGQL